MKTFDSPNDWTPGAARMLGRGLWLLLIVCLGWGITPARAEDSPAKPAEAAAEEVAEAAEDEAQDEDTSDAEEEDAEESDTALTPAQLFEGGEDALENWMEFSVGGLITRGNRAQAEQRHRLTRGMMGGLEDLHLQRDLDKKTTLLVDGRALFDLDDYKLRLELRREDLGYLRFGYENFRVWSGSTGGYFPAAGSPGMWSRDALTLDRGEISFETGLTLPKLPVLTFKYTHRYRDGEKDSTIWSPTRPSATDFSLVRGLAPAIYDLDERVDIFELNATHQIKATELGLGLRYETGDLDNTYRTVVWPSDPAKWSLTDRQKTTYDLFNVHAFTETWLKKNLFFSTGFLFSDLDTDFSGRRIYGDDFDVGYVPSALGYTDLSGGSQKREYVLNLNLMAIPVKNLTCVPSIRVLREDWDAVSGGYGTLGAAGETFRGRSEGDLLDVRERLEMRYTGVTNWVFTGAGEWTQGEGNLKEAGGLSRIGSVGVAPIARATEDERFFQKYSLGTRWYAAPGLTLDLGGYYKIHDYDYDHSFDDTPNNSGNRYPAYLVMQRFETLDGNLRVTWRPWSQLTLVSRYEFQRSTIDTKPDAISSLRRTETSAMTSHIFAQNVSWTPWTRLYLQAGFNYVWSETETPTSDYTRAVLDAQNNYWTLHFNSGLTLDDKTDLNLGYFYYRADNFKDHSAEGLPLGLGAEEHGVTAALTRRINKNLRVTLRYGYFHYDEASAGHRNDYEAHFVSTGLQYRF